MVYYGQTVCFRDEFSSTTMDAIRTHEIQALHDRYSRAAAHSNCSELNSVIIDCERLLQIGELTGHEKAVVYRLLGDALFSLDIAEKACIAYLTSQQYFKAESNDLAVASLEVGLAGIFANSAMSQGSGYLLLAAKSRIHRVSEQIRLLGDHELLAKVSALLGRIEAWEQARQFERTNHRDNLETFTNQEGAASLRDPEEIESSRIADAVYRERTTKMDTAWRAASRSTIAAGDSVDCAVFSPPEVPPDSYLLVQAFVYLPDQLQEAAEDAKAHDSESTIRGSTNLELEVQRGAILAFELNLPNAEIDEPYQSHRWSGRTTYVTFATKFTKQAAGAQIGKLLVTLNDIPVGVIRFLITVSPRAPENLAWLETDPKGRATRYRSVFISYASRDRSEVLRRVQLLEALGIKYFQDLLSLDPGQRWEKEVYRAIDNADLFLLFWSNAARDSAWVRKEICYAIDLKQGNDEAPPEIIPIVIEGPPAPEPPEELSHLQFSDRILYFLPRKKAIVRNSWVKCPGCGFRFATYGETWDGRKHKRCGTLLELVEGN